MADKIKVTYTNQDGESIEHEVDKAVYNKIRSDARIGTDIDVKKRLAKFDHLVEGLDLEGQKGYKALESVLSNAMDKISNLTTDLEKAKAGKPPTTTSIDINAELKKRESELHKTFDEKQKSMDIKNQWSALKNISIKNGLKENYYDSFQPLIQSKYQIQLDSNNNAVIVDKGEEVIAGQNGLLTLEELSKRLVNEFPEIHQVAKTYEPKSQTGSLNGQGLRTRDKKDATAFELIENGVSDLKLDLQEVAKKNLIY